MRRLQSLRWAMLVAGVGLCGCGNRLHPVEGQLVWPDGQPAKELAGSMVYFESAEHHTVSRSEVLADGTFRLTTERPGGDGVPPGTHRVYVAEKRSGGPADDFKPVSPALMDERFGKPDTSGLEVTVPPPDGRVVLKVDRAPRRR
jgi:hypothetical protein